jgi:hypothetical protein
MKQIIQSELPLSEERVIECLSTEDKLEFIVNIRLYELISCDINNLNELIDEKIVQEYEDTSVILVDISYEIESKIDNETVALKVTGHFEEI